MPSTKLVVCQAITKLSDYGFIRYYVGYSLLIYQNGSILLALLFYVDDIILGGNDSEAYNEFKEYPNSCSQMKYLGPLNYFLAIELAKGPLGLFLYSRKYALEIVDECGLLGSKLVESLIEENHKLALAIMKHLDDPGRYQCLVGCLIYLTITHPKLCYDVHILSQFM